MSATLIIIVLIAYFSVLVGISFLTSRKATNDTFFLGERKSPWYVVSYGMIGASLSGVTFISIPGWVGNESNQFSYMQAVFGYLVGYFIIAYVLLPLYYRLNLTSIYEYLQQRFGTWSYKTGAAFFLLSRIVGSSIRLLLVANVLQSILFDAWGIPFEITVIISVLLIWIYTSRGGIKTIVWTDTLQTTFMLASVVLTVWFISDALNLAEGETIYSTVKNSNYSQIFFFDDLMGSNHFLKHFFGGMFIAIGMTGLDQDMMQKNLSCKNIKEAQKNMITMSLLLTVVNLVFLCLGALLYLYAESNPNLKGATGDLLFSSIAMSEEVGPLIGILFLLGLIAAAYSSADSALTALTTSFSVDFLGIKDKKKDVLMDQLIDQPVTVKSKDNPERTRKTVHIAMSGVIVVTVILFKYATNESAIDLVMKLAGFTYGPLIGMFFFGILSKRFVKDKVVPFVCFGSILLTILIWYFSSGAPGNPDGNFGIFGNYKFGFEIIILNAFITFIGISLFSKQKEQTTSNENSVTR